MTAWADDKPTSEDIEPQPLNEALREFADRSGLQVVYRTQLASGIETGGTDAPVDEREALDQLLASTGLAYRFINDRTISIQAVDAEVARDSGNVQLAPSPVMMAQASETRVGTSPIDGQNDGASGIVSGKVTDARTGANLKGALITVESTGQTTSTDDLGRFRIVGVPVGEQHVSASFLGYVRDAIGASVVEGEVIALNFTLRGGSDLEEIVVYGQRSARALALNQERTATNASTVLSADLLGQFNGTTISEALRRAPGVAFELDPVTGQGANIILRGLEPDLNQVQLNGIRLLEGTGKGRSPDLSNILTENIESVTINKTLLPSQDSNGAGGLVQIETKSPLDRNRRYLNFSGEYGRRSDQDFGDSFQVSGTASGTIGSSDDFGTSLSVSYREEDFTNINYSANLSSAGAYLPAGVRSVSDIDPRMSFPFEEGADELFVSTVGANQGRSEQETLSLNVSLEKQFGSDTNIRFDYTRNDQSTTTSSLTTRTETFAHYGQSGPIEELDGEERAFYAWDGSVFGFPSGSLPGGVTRVAQFDPDIEEISEVFSLRGDSAIDTWTFRYSAGYSSAETRSPTSTLFLLGESFQDSFTIDPALLSDEILSNTRNGLIVSLFAPVMPGDNNEFVLPGLNQAGFDFFNDLSKQNIRRIDVDPMVVGKSNAITLDGSVRRDFQSSSFSYAEVGFNYQETSFESDRKGLTQFYEPVGDVVAPELGLVYTDGLLTRVGAENDFSALEIDNIASVFGGLDSLVDQGLLTFREGSRFEDARDTTEENVAAYFQTKFKTGKLEIVGGVRVDQTQIESTFFDAPSIRDVNGDRETDLEAELAQFVSESVSQIDVLPRIIANYRFNENKIFRLSYFNTFSRPQLDNLTSRRSISINLEPRSGPNSDQPALSIRRGNPDLEPAVTHNFDLAFEYYEADIGVYKANVFYKEIKNSLQSNTIFGDGVEIPDDVVLPDKELFQNLPDNISISVSQPVNSNETDTIWGMELVGERQLNMLPGAFSGLGIYVNYTYTDSDSTRQLATSFVPEGFVEVSNVPFNGSPDHSGTVGLTYNKYGVDATLFYSWQSRRLSGFDGFGLSSYNEAIDTLDFRVDYLREFLGNTVRLFLRGEDLLRDVGDSYLQRSIGGEGAVPRYTAGQTFLGGRRVSIGAAIVF